MRKQASKQKGGKGNLIKARNYHEKRSRNHSTS